MKHLYLAIQLVIDRLAIGLMLPLPLSTTSILKLQFLAILIRLLNWFQLLYVFWGMGPMKLRRIVSRHLYLIVFCDESHIWAVQYVIGFNPS